MVGSATGSYIEGFLAGQTVAYCERVTTGGGLAAQLVCPKKYVKTLSRIIVAEECKVLVQPHDRHRVSLWIYRHDSVKSLISAVQSIHGPSDVGMWSMGKLFGYSNQDVLAFMERSKSPHR